MTSVQRTFRLNEVSKITALHRSSIRRKVNDDTFPKPMIEGTRTPVWHEFDIVAYQNKLREKAGLPALEEQVKADARSQSAKPVSEQPSPLLTSEQAR